MTVLLKTVFLQCLRIHVRCAVRVHDLASPDRRVHRQMLAACEKAVPCTDDDILPLSDAYAFQQDLQQCVAVKEVAGSGHSPHLDNPDVVVNHLKEFILS